MLVMIVIGNDCKKHVAALMRPFWLFVFVCVVETVIIIVIDIIIISAVSIVTVVTVVIDFVVTTLNIARMASVAVLFTQ